MKIEYCQVRSRAVNNGGYLFFEAVTVAIELNVRRHMFTVTHVFDIVTDTNILCDAT